MSYQIHINDVGTEFRITIMDNSAVVNISSATLLEIIFQKPDTTDLVVNADLYTDGTDGVLYYRVVSGDLDQSGIFKIQAYVEISGGSYYSSIGSFKVHCNLRQ